MCLPDSLYRFAYRRGIKLARVWWQLGGGRASAAHVFVWHQGRVLLLRTSYSTGWTMPGGVIKRRETPIDAAIREASEEVGLQLTAADLRPVGIIEHSPEYQRDQGYFFEVQLERWPDIRIDNREIVEARFVTPADALSFAMARVFRDYLSRKAAEARQASA